MTALATNRRSRRRSRSRSADDGEAGFSLVELVVVSALMLVILTAVMQIFLSVNKRAHLVEDRTAKLEQVRKTLSQLDRELRQATIVNTVSGSTVDFCTYLKPTDSTTTKIVYTAGADGVLTRKVGTASAVGVLDGLANQAVFASGDASRPTTEVVSIDLQVKPALSPNTVIVLDSDVRLRNIQEVVTC